MAISWEEETIQRRSSITFRRKMDFKNRLPGIFCLSLILLLAGAGCGGGGDQSQAPVSTTSAGAPSQESAAPARTRYQESPISARASSQESTAPARRRYQEIAASATPSMPESPPADAPKMDVKGSIVFSKMAGGYYINGEEPAGRFIIVNQDPKLLGELLKSGKTVNIEGRLIMGVELLFIDRIEGNSYYGTQEPVFDR